MAPTCLYALPTASKHAPDEIMDGTLGDLVPDLDQGISELLDNLCCYLVAVDAPIHIIPGSQLDSGLRIMKASQ